MLIYNTLTKNKEEFNPKTQGAVKMYACGVTVYDYCHIGHARSLYVFEVIRRYFNYRGFKVTFVRNVTDIDDKIIARANELGIDFSELVDKYIACYREDLAALGIPEADIEPRATENIKEMIDYVRRLIDKGYAYATETGVYFSVRKFKDYGKLSRQGVDDMLCGTRIAKDETKKDPLDFALWKTAKEGEPYWDSPWGKGRPGWHIECSVMSQKYLNQETIDIHGGGRDLIFPHHENEIAQSESLTGKPFAKYWIHHGLLTINKEKMAKSLGNFFTIREVLKKYSPEVLKILYLQAHHSSPLDFSWERMDEAKRAYERIDILLGKLQRLIDNQDCVQSKRSAKFKEEFVAAMDDDFNTPKGLAVLFDLVAKCNSLLEGASPPKGELACARSLIFEIAAVFHLSFLKQAQLEISEIEIKEAIASRNRLRGVKKYAEADRVRKQLEEKGIILEDTNEGTSWRKKL